MSKKKKHQSSTPTGKQIQSPNIRQSYWWAHAILILLLGLLIYSSTTNSAFHFDDIPNIIENANIQTSDISHIYASGTSRFLPLLTIAWNYDLSAFDVQSYHYVNICIHLLNGLIVYWLTLLILATPGVKQQSITMTPNVFALCAALIFIAHPLATQSVTYIVQRMASMAALFYLLSVSMYLKARMSSHVLRMTLLVSGSVICALAAFHSKENAFSLPVTLLLCELALMRDRQKITKLKIGSIVGILAISILGALWIFHRYKTSIFDTVAPSFGNNYSISAKDYLLTQFSVIIKYIQLLIAPIHQNLDYNYVISRNLTEPRALGSLFFLLLLISFSVYIWKKNRLISFAIFWFFITLSIESSIVPLPDVIFEHRTYLPSFAYCLALTWCIFHLTRNYETFVLFGTMLAAVSSYAIMAHERNTVWLTEYSLWKDTVSKSPNKPRPNANFGKALFAIGKTDSAMIYLNKSISLNENYYDAYNFRGNIYAQSQQYKKALADFHACIRLDPKNPKGYCNVGNIYGSMGIYDSSISAFNKAIELDTTFVMAYMNRALTYMIMQHYRKSLADYEQVLRLLPGNQDAVMGKNQALEKLRSEEGLFMP